MQREHAGFPVVLHNTRRAIDVLELQQPGVRAAVGVDQTVHAEIAVMRPLIAVSYTHLDVYKRQVQSRDGTADADGLR